MQKTTQEKVDYWIDLADEDISAAKSLLKSKHFLQTGFFCHLTIEKALKAAITNNTNEIPPKIHDLEKLAKRGGILEILSDQQLKIMDDLMPMQIEARYPENKDKLASKLTEGYCKELIEKTEGLLCWIKQQLGR